MPDWSHSNWAVAAIANWLISSASIRTPSPVDDSSYSLRTWKWTARAKPALDVSAWKKNARNNRCYRDSSGARHRRRSHHRVEVDRKTTEKIAEVLQQIDIPVSANTVARLLHQMDVSLLVDC